MKQLFFGFEDVSIEPPVTLDERTEKELVEAMAAAIAVVHTKRVEGSDDGSPREQDHPGAS